MIDNHSEFDQKTRATLAYIWTGAIILFIGYITYQFGSAKEILTLLIGFITGTAATILAVYFGAPIASKKTDTSVTQTGDQPSVNVTPPAPDEK